MMPSNKLIKILITLVSVLSFSIYHTVYAKGRTPATAYRDSLRKLEEFKYLIEKPKPAVATKQEPGFLYNSLEQLYYFIFSKYGLLVVVIIAIVATIRYLLPRIQEAHAQKNSDEVEKLSLLMGGLIWFELGIIVWAFTDSVVAVWLPIIVGVFVAIIRGGKVDENDTNKPKSIQQRFIQQAMDLWELLTRKSKATQPVVLVSEELPTNLDEIRFPSEFERAFAAADFRLLIRLHYLQTLKILQDTEQIQWSPNKTNAQYIQELKNPIAQTGFANLTRVYDYVWYGKRALNVEQYELLVLDFKSFQAQFIYPKAA